MPEPDTPVTTESRASGKRTSTSFRLCSVAPTTSTAGVRFRHRAARLQRVLQRLAQEMAGDRVGIRLELLRRALRDDAPAQPSRAGTQVDHVLGAADGVLVVLDHHQRVALGAELGERVEQDLVVARMQADGGLVEDVAHAAQVGAELRREPDALRLAARERGRAAVEREVAQPHLLEEAEARGELGEDVARDLLLATRHGELLEEACAPPRSAARSCRRSIVPGSAPRAPRGSGACRRTRAGLVQLQPFDPRIQHVVLGAGLGALLVPLHLFDLEARAVAARRTSRAWSCTRRGAGRAPGSCGRTTGRRASPRRSASRARPSRRSTRAARPCPSRARPRRRGAAASRSRASPPPRPPAARWCARGSGRGAASPWSAGTRRPRAGARRPCRTPTSRGRCRSPCGWSPAARAPRWTCRAAPS